MTKLLDNVSVDTDGTGIVGDGGPRQVIIWATNYGGGSVTLQTSPDNSNWITLTYGGNPAVFTANTSLLINRIAQGFYIRATLTGSTGADAVNVEMQQ